MSSCNGERVDVIKQCLATFPDFPKEGIDFVDVMPLFRSPRVFKDLVQLFAEQTHNLQFLPDVIIGLESRGFLIGAPVALELGIPFAPIRKKGKLPGPVSQISYDLEYGSDSFEIQQSAIKPGDKVVIMDDLLATGGTMAAAIDLIKQLKGEVIECQVIVELLELNGRTKIDQKAPCFSLVQL